MECMFPNCKRDATLRITAESETTHVDVCKPHAGLMSQIVPRRFPDLDMLITAIPEGCCLKRSSDGGPYDPGIPTCCDA